MQAGTSTNMPWPEEYSATSIVANALRSFFVEDHCMPARAKRRSTFLNDSVTRVNGGAMAALFSITRGMVPPIDGDPR